MAKRKSMENEQKKWVSNSQKKEYKWSIKSKKMFNMTSNQKCKIKQSSIFHPSDWRKLKTLIKVMVDYG